MPRPPCIAAKTGSRGSAKAMGTPTSLGARRVWPVVALVLISVLSVHHVAAVVDRTKLQQYFIIREIEPYECALSWQDGGSRAPTDLTVWNCQNLASVDQPFAPFGSFACGERPSDGARDNKLLVQCLKKNVAYLGFPAFNIPNTDPVGRLSDSYYRIWDNKERRWYVPGCTVYGYPAAIWMANEVANYKSTGNWWSADGKYHDCDWFDTPPSAGSNLLVHNRCLQPCTDAIPKYSPPLIWSNKGNKQNDITVSIYSSGQDVTVGSTYYRYYYGGSLAQTNYNDPNRQMCIRKECVRQDQVDNMYQGETVYNWGVDAPSLRYDPSARMVDVTNDASNPAVKQVTISTTTDDKATLKMSNSLGYSTTVSTPSPLYFSLDHEIMSPRDGKLTFKQLFTYDTGDVAMNNEAVSTVTQVRGWHDFEVVVPAATSLVCNLVVARTDGYKLPIRQKMYYTAFKYQGARRIPVETKDAMRNLLEATGFDGDMGDYQYSNKSQATFVKADLTLNMAVQDHVNCTCAPTSSDTCPTSITVQSIEGAAFASLQGRMVDTDTVAKKFRVRGLPAEFVWDISQAGTIKTASNTDDAPWPMKPAPRGSRYYHIKPDLLSKLRSLEKKAP